jgi:hypothetical protein
LSGAAQNPEFFAAADPGPRDWRPLFRELGAATAALAQAPLIQADPRARGLVRRIADAKDLEELDCCVDLLALRLSELLAAAGATPGTLAFAPSRAAPPSARAGGLDDDDAPARTFLRL